VIVASGFVDFATGRYSIVTAPGAGSPAQVKVFVFPLMPPIGQKTASAKSENAKSAGKTDKELATAQDFQRKAQFYLDFVEAENSTGFHAPQEAARILGESIDFSRKGQIALRDGQGELKSQTAKP